MIIGANTFSTVQAQLRQIRNETAAGIPPPPPPPLFPEDTDMRPNRGPSGKLLSFFFLFFHLTNAAETST